MNTQACVRVSALSFSIHYKWCYVFLLWDLCYSSNWLCSSLHAVRTAVISLQVNEVINLSILLTSHSHIIRCFINCCQIGKLLWDPFLCDHVGLPYPLVRISVRYQKPHFDLWGKMSHIRVIKRNKNKLVRNWGN